MVLIQNELILWTGKKHCGKTTSVAKLAQKACDEGFAVAGLLAPCLYRNGKLVGFDVLDLRNKNRAPLARRRANAGKTEPFTFIDEGLKLGRDALSRAATKSDELIIVDEFGPLELGGDGWRKNVDLLLTSSNALILLVVREELAERVQQLYATVLSRRLFAAEPHSIDKVITALKNRCKVKATAIIMAGGGSGRMGADKSMLPINGRTMIEHICEQLGGSFEQILISANEPEKFAFLGLPIVRDKKPGQGPLMGIASALEASANEFNFVVACDIPHIEMSCVRKMLAESKGADIVVPIAGDEKYEPLFAVYCKSALEAINQVLSAGGRKITDVFSRCRVRYIELADQQFANLNTMAEYEEFRKKYEQKAK